VITLRGKKVIDRKDRKRQTSRIKEYRILFEHSEEQKHLTSQVEYLSLSTDNSWVVQDYLLIFGRSL